MVRSTVKIVSSVLVLLIIIFSIDYLFFRHLFWQRLIVNIGIFLVYSLIYFKYLSKE
jgi:hypothetical protein